MFFTSTRSFSSSGFLSGMVELGLIPDLQFATDLGITDSQGRIVVNSKCATSRLGVFAAGDVTDIFVEQVLICIGEGVKAALSAYEYLL